MRRRGIGRNSLRQAGGLTDGRRRGPKGRAARAGPTRRVSLKMEPVHETDSVVPCPAARVHSPCRGSIGEESNRLGVNRLRSPPMVTSRPRREACKAPPGPCSPQGPRRSRAGRAVHLDAGGRPMSQWRLPFSSIPDSCWVTVWRRARLPLHILRSAGKLPSRNRQRSRFSRVIRRPGGKQRHRATSSARHRIALVRAVLRRGGSGGIPAGLRGSACALSETGNTVTSTRWPWVGAELRRQASRVLAGYAAKQLV